MTDIATTRRQLKIKSGAVQRLFKETRMYRAEAEELGKKIPHFTDGEEDWESKNVKKRRDESQKMVKDTTERLNKAAEALETLIVGTKEKGEMSQDEELLKAEKVLQEARISCMMGEEQG